MNKKSSDNEFKLDAVKWILIGLLIAGGVVANSVYSAQPAALRVIAWIALLAVVFTIAAMTQKGRWAIAFAQESQVEMRKVVWPTKQETVQTTLIVIAMVLIAGILLWGIDNLFLWLVGKVTNLR